MITKERIQCMYREGCMSNNPVDRAVEFDALCTLALKGLAAEKLETACEDALFVEDYWDVTQKYKSVRVEINEALAEYRKEIEKE